MNNKLYIKTFLNILFYVVIISIVICLLMASTAKRNGKQPQLFGYSTYTILSGSMSPNIKTGSIVIVKHIKPEDIKEKDIITFSSKTSSNITTHRVNKVLTSNSLSFSTKGDANLIEDPVPIESNQVIGKVAFHISYLGYLINFAKENKLIVLTLIIVFIAIIYLFRRWKKVKKHRNRQVV